MTNRYAGFASEVKDRLFSRLDHRKHTVSIYGRFNAPFDREMVEKINGDDQYFLKMTMQASDIDLIWYDREYNKYRFWGATKFKVVDAMNRIRSRIIKYAVHVPADQQQAPQKQAPQKAAQQAVQQEEKWKPIVIGQSSYKDWQAKSQEFENTQEAYKNQQKAALLRTQLYQIDRERELKRQQEDAEFLVKKIIDFDPEIVSIAKYKKGEVLADDVLQEFMLNGNFEKSNYANELNELCEDFDEYEGQDAENIRQDIKHEFQDLMERKQYLEKLLKQTQTHLLLAEKVVCVDDSIDDTLLPMMNKMKL
jgi:hypothetical protein